MNKRYWGPYKAIFLLPFEARATLEESGWSFESVHFISPSELEALVSRLSLTLSESYFGMDEYTGGDLKVVVTHEVGGIASIYLRNYGSENLRGQLESWLTLFGGTESFVIFDPSGRRP